MAKKQSVTRAERRAIRATVPDARVYVVEIKDAGADSWISRVALFAESPTAASERLRVVGLDTPARALRMPNEDVPAEAVEVATANPDACFISQLNDDGWSCWFPLPPGYVHPPQGQAAKHPELRLRPPPTPTEDP